MGFRRRMGERVGLRNRKRRRGGFRFLKAERGMMSKGKRHRVCFASELRAGERRIVQAGERSMGVFNVNGVYVAVLNVCPHELAPVCAGAVGGTTERSEPGEYVYAREGEILRCPWHGWEFDLLSGACLTDARKLKRFAVEVETGVVYVLAESVAGGAGS